MTTIQQIVLERFGTIPENQLEEAVIRAGMKLQRIISRQSDPFSAFECFGTEYIAELTCEEIESMRMAETLMNDYTHRSLSPSRCSPANIAMSLYTKVTTAMFFQTAPLFAKTVAAPK